MTTTWAWVTAVAIFALGLGLYVGFCWLCLHLAPDDPWPDNDPHVHGRTGRCWGGGEAAR
jgi:hypothetical protein